MNPSTRRLLPPIGALASFVAAARHGSFSRAGEEMGLTQSAVSRQIAVLEDWVQATLFVRRGRRVELNGQGEAYARAIGPALDRIRSASASLLERRAESELNIATLPGFGMRWLAPRLRQLSERHPGVVVNFAARSFPFNFGDEPFDAAIHFGLPDWPDGTHDRLFSEETVPVCSPRMLERRPVARAEDLLDWPLLVQSSRRDAWSRWFALAGIGRQTPTPAASFDHFLMLAQAAASGAGIALVPLFLIEEELASGQLVSPMPMPMSGQEAYYLVLPEGRQTPPALADFREWLIREAREFEAAGGRQGSSRRC